MKSEAILELLEAVAGQLEVRVSYEALQTNLVQTGMRGGLCKVKGPSGMEWRLIVDKRATAEERITTIATSLSRFDTSTLDLRKEVRETLRVHDQKSAQSRPVKANRPAAA